MSSFSIGLSALRANQYALELVSNNVANANTVGYHRQLVQFSSRVPNNFRGLRIGSGVDVGYIQRVRNQVTEASLTQVISDVSNSKQLVEIEKRIEEAFVSGENSISSHIDQLFGEMTKLSASPDEAAQRESVLESTRRLTRSLNDGTSALIDLKHSIRFQLEKEVESLNADMEVLGELNARIFSLEARGLEANAELDDRDALLNKMAENIGVSRRESLSGDLNFTFGNASIQQTSKTNRFELADLGEGRIGVLLNESERAVDSQSGRIHALVTAYNSIVPKYEGRLEEFTTELISKFDAAHAVGIGASGSFTQLAGTRAVELHDVPLSESGAAFPISAGDLAITVVAQDGSQVTEVISIDPSVDTLEDVAARISTINGIGASVNANTQKLQIYSQSGFQFNFTGGISTVPDLSSYTGTALPEFAGSYTGQSNEELEFRIVGSGDVGVTEGLQLQVYGEDGALRGEFDIGLGYEAGTEIDLGEGVLVKFPRGTVVDGETFQNRVTAKPDQTGILTALGLNSFFEGTNASDVRLASAIEQDSLRFAAGRTGDSADTQNLLGMLELEGYRGLPGNLTMHGFINDVTTEIGFEIQSELSLSISLEGIQTRLQEEKDAVSGVDLNEELVYLQQYQKSYEASVRVIQTTDQMLDELFAIIR